LSGPIGFLLQRGRLDKNRIHELQKFGRLGEQYHLVVFPEGTRGDGVNMQPCQPGIYYVARQAQLPIVPVFIENMQSVSTKSGRFHPFGGLRKVEIHFGDPIPPRKYLDMSREEFLRFTRNCIVSAKRLPEASPLASVCQRA